MELVKRYRVGWIWHRLLILDAKLYLAAAWYLDQVLPGTFGPRQHWTFVLRPSYWCRSYPFGHGVDPACKSCITASHICHVLLI